MHGVEHDAGDLDERVALAGGGAGVDRDPLPRAREAFVLEGPGGGDLTGEEALGKASAPQHEAHGGGAVIAGPAVLLRAGIGVRPGRHPHRRG